MINYGYWKPLVEDKQELICFTVHPMVPIMLHCVTELITRFLAIIAYFSCIIYTMPLP